MGGLLLQQHFNVLRDLKPDLSDAGADWALGFANAILEYDEGNQPARHVHDIAGHRLQSRLGRERLMEAMRLRSVAAYQEGLAACRAHGVVSSFYEMDRSTGRWYLRPTNELIDPVAAHVALEHTKRAAVDHLEGRVLSPVHLIGERWCARRPHREAIDELVVPSSPAEAVDALVEQACLAHVGRVGTDSYPEWSPTGFAAAAALVEGVSQYTGDPLEVGPAPAVRYSGARPVITVELRELLPERVIAFGVPAREVPTASRAAGSPVATASPGAVAFAAAAAGGSAAPRGRQPGGSSESRADRVLRKLAERAAAEASRAVA